MKTYTFEAYLDKKTSKAKRFRIPHKGSIWIPKSVIISKKQTKGKLYSITIKKWFFDKNDFFKNKPSIELPYNDFAEINQRHSTNTKMTWLSKLKKS